jgi:HK97 family phage portal protein
MFFDALFKARSKLSGVTNPEQWLVDWVTDGRATASGEKINEQTALTVAAFYGAVKILSETVASLPLEVFRRLPGGGREPDYDHPMYRVLHDEPNPEVSSFNWRETGQQHLCTFGNAFNEIQRDFLGKEPVAIYGLSPKQTKPVRAADGRIVYEHRDPAGGKPDIIEQRDVLHVPGMGFDGLVGYSPISLLQEPIGAAKAGERFGAEMFANHGAHSGVLQSPNALSDKAYRRLQKAMTEKSKAGNRHKTLLLEEATTWAATNMKARDLQAIEARRFSVEEIARIFRISLHLLQEFTEGAASYASIVELGREFIVYTMMPWLKRWQAEINRKLLDAEHFCEFNVAAFLQGDHKARAEFYNKMFMVGGVTVNEIMGLENRNPIGPEGDVRFVPKNLQPLEKAIKAEDPKPPPPAIPPPSDDDGDDDQGDDQDAPPAKMQPTLAEIREEYQELLRRRQERSVQAARQVIADVMGRMVHKEQNAARRAAGRPDRFLEWLDQFYAGHGTTITGALHNPIAALQAATDAPCDVVAEASRFAREHCNRNREALLKAAECKAAKLPDRVAECVAGFTNEILFQEEFAT